MKKSCLFSYDYLHILHRVRAEQVTFLGLGRNFSSKFLLFASEKPGRFSADRHYHHVLRSSAKLRQCR